MRQGQCVLILLDPSGILLPYFFFLDAVQSHLSSSLLSDLV